jgi:hypothetical protein
MEKTHIKSLIEIDSLKKEIKSLTIQNTAMTEDMMGIK